MNQQQYHLFNRSECGNTPYAAEVAVYGLTSMYSLDWKNPPPGWYYFIFSTEAPGNSAITTPFVLVATFNQAETSTEYNVVTNQVTLQNTQTLTSVQVSQVSSLTTPAAPTILVIAAVIVVAVVAALFLVRSRKGKPPRSVEAKKLDSTTKKAVSGKAFCIECGNALPLGSKFCNKCGTSQE
jgi:ribosomal protein L40E